MLPRVGSASQVDRALDLANLPCQIEKPQPTIVYRKVRWLYRVNGYIPICQLTILSCRSKIELSILPPAFTRCIDYLSVIYL